MIKRILLLFLVTMPILATSTTFQSKNGQVYINELLVFTLKTNKDGLTPDQRAKMIVAKLKAQPHKQPVTVQVQKGAACIKIGQAIAARIHSAEAKAQKTSISVLAKTWADNIRRAYKMPRVVMSRTHVKMPLGAQAVIPVSGRAAEKAQLAIDTAGVVNATYAGRQLMISSKTAGKTKILLTHKNETQALVVHSMPFAAQIPNVVQADVMGCPCHDRSVKRAIKQAIFKASDIKPGARVRMSVQDVSSLMPSANKSYSVKVHVHSENSYPVKKHVQVQVSNRGMFRHDEKTLWYCNHPERLMCTGLISAIDLEQNSPMRVLYHHTNDARKDLAFQFLVRNPSDKTAHLALMVGDGTPHTDPVRVGLEAGSHFVRSWLNGSGQIVQVPPRSVHPVSVRILKPNQTVSGIAYMYLFSDAVNKVQVVAQADDPYQIDPQWKSVASHVDYWGAFDSREISAKESDVKTVTDSLFANPFKNVRADYQVGGDFAFIRVGQKPIENLDKSKVLDGNFGVFYTVDINVSNPTSLEANVEVSFEASAGYSGAVFVIDGQMIKVPLLQTKGKYVLKSLKMPPGATRKLNLMTMPLSGSSYPATITVRPQDKSTMRLVRL